MRVRYMNANGTGYSDWVEVESGTTISQFFSQKMGSRSPGSYEIRVNRAECTPDQVLNDGDRISITAKNYTGAIILIFSRQNYSAMGLAA